LFVWNLNQKRYIISYPSLCKGHKGLREVPGQVLKKFRGSIVIDRVRAIDFRDCFAMLSRNVPNGIGHECPSYAEPLVGVGAHGSLPAVNNRHETGPWNSPAEGA